MSAQERERVSPLFRSGSKKKMRGRRIETDRVRLESPAGYSQIFPPLPRIISDGFADTGENFVDAGGKGRELERESNRVGDTGRKFVTGDVVFRAFRNARSISRQRQRFVSERRVDRQCCRSINERVIRKGWKGFRILVNETRRLRLSKIFLSFFIYICIYICTKLLSFSLSVSLSLRCTRFDDLTCSNFTAILRLRARDKRISTARSITGQIWPR